MGKSMSDGVVTTSINPARAASDQVKAKAKDRIDDLPDDAICIGVVSFHPGGACILGHDVESMSVPEVLGALDLLKDRIMRHSLNVDE